MYRPSRCPNRQYPPLRLANTGRKGPARRAAQTPMRWVRGMVLKSGTILSYITFSVPGCIISARCLHLVVVRSLEQQLGKLIALLLAQVCNESVDGLKEVSSRLLRDLFALLRQLDADDAPIRRIDGALD